MHDSTPLLPVLLYIILPQSKGFLFQSSIYDPSAILLGPSIYNLSSSPSCHTFHAIYVFLHTHIPHGHSSRQFTYQNMLKVVEQNVFLSLIIVDPSDFALI